MNPSDQVSPSWQETLRDCFEQIRYARATDLARARRYLEAEALLMPHGQHPIALRELDLLARICAQQRQYERARNYWEAALQKSPGNTAYQIAIARAAEAQQHRASMRKVEHIALCILLFCITAVGVWAFYQKRNNAVTSLAGASPPSIGSGLGMPSPQMPPLHSVQPANEEAHSTSPLISTPGSLVSASSPVLATAPTESISSSPKPPNLVSSSASLPVAVAPAPTVSPTIPLDSTPSP